MTTTQAQTFKWPGDSGIEYQYWIYPIGASFKKVPGNYVFAEKTPAGRWTPIYIGETGDLSERFDHHHKMRCIKWNSATHIHVHTSSSDEKARRTEETDLIMKWNPSCNAIENEDAESSRYQG